MYLYTGTADVLSVNGKTYAKDHLYNANPEKYDGSLSKPINISKEVALYLSANSDLHRFESTSGKDLLDEATSSSK